LELDAKLKVFDRHAEDAVGALIQWLRDHGDDLIAVARGRHVEGHYRYAEQGLFEHDAQALLAEASQELGDAIVYMSRRAHLLEGFTDA
jgi:hypothetical protein